MLKLPDPLSSPDDRVRREIIAHLRRRSQRQRKVAVCSPPDGLNLQHERFEPFRALWTGLALPTVTDLDAVRTDLLGAAPSLPGLIEWIVGELALRRTLGDGVACLPPILLHGPPGVGKTHLARAIATALAVPSRLVNLAGSSDARMILGTSAGYASGMPSLPAQVMAQTGCAAPMLLLDEIDKVQKGSSNGTWYDALLPFLEPVSACGVLDEFLMTELDLSRVGWVATANEIARVPKPLVSRMACFEVSKASCADAAAVLDRARRAVVRDLGLTDVEMHLLLDEDLCRPVDLPAGASVRDAKALLRAALGARILGATRH